MQSNDAVFSDQPSQPHVIRSICHFITHLMEDGQASQAGHETERDWSAMHGY